MVADNALRREDDETHLFSRFSVARLSSYFAYAVKIVFLLRSWVKYKYSYTENTKLGNFYQNAF